MGSLPLIHSLENPDCTQVWYADDVSACGNIKALRKWFSLVEKRGPLFGYFPQPSKTFLVVDEQFVSDAKSIFCETGINVVCSRRLLGGVIGNEDGKMTYVERMVKMEV